MKTIKIVTDSSITIEPNLVEQYGITIIPLSVMVDGEIYSDADLKEGEFFHLMETSKKIPKTSQPPVGLFSECYKELAKDGSQIISIHMSHGLSGTVESARQGAKLAGVPVTVVDSQFTDQAMKFQVVEAAKLAQEGNDEATILSEIQAIQEKTELYIAVSNLENLVKGGRISRVTGLLTNFLNIKVVMQMKNHELKPILKGRGQKSFYKWLSQFETSLKNKEVAEIAISYCGSAELGEDFKKRLQPFVKKEISVLETSSIIQTHTGKGAWAVLIRYQS